MKTTKKSSPADVLDGLFVEWSWLCHAKGLDADGIDADADRLRQLPPDDAAALLQQAIDRLAVSEDTMTREDFIKNYVRPDYRPYSDESYSKYVRRCWPAIADVLLLRGADRARALDEPGVQTLLDFSRETWELCTGRPWPPAKFKVEAFLESLRRAGNVVDELPPLREDDDD